MDIKQIETIIEKIFDKKTKRLWRHYFVALLIFILISFALEFVNKKAQNLATKSDIESLTAKVESVKYEYIKKSKLEETLLNSRIKIYEKCTLLKEIILKRKNNLGNEKELMEMLFNQLRELQIQLDINVQLKEEFKNEISAINTSYNKIIYYIKQLQLSGAKRYNIDLDEIGTNIDNIQIKILQ
ncbi:MAG: hypothetical protein JEY94_04960 [Melioribacteraceae bacterium]|nr:hypothetical protein [Melioribacteraceae bacterium]